MIMDSLMGGSVQLLVVAYVNNMFDLNWQVGEKRNNYSFYLSNATGLPIGFEMRGYDDLLVWKSRFDFQW